MTYGVRYRIRYSDYYDRVITADIEQRGYTGDVELIQDYGVAPLVYSIGNVSASPYEPICGSSVVLTVNANIRLQFFNLYTTDESLYVLKIYVDDVMDWIGLIVPDLYTEPIQQFGNRFVSFTFTDGLGFLSEVDYETDIWPTGWSISDPDHLRTILQAILQRTGLYLPLHISASFKYDGNLAVFDLLRYNRLFAEGETCQYALETILRTFGLRVYLEKNHWRVDQIDDLINTLTFNRYHPSGTVEGPNYTESVITVPTNTINDPSLIIPASGTMLKTFPGWKQYTLELKYNKIEELAPRDYASWGENANPPSSTRIGTIWNDSDFIFDILEAHPSTIDWDTILKAQATIEEFKESAERIFFKFTYMCAGTDSYDVYIMVQIGAKYLLSTGGWTTDLNRIKIKDGALGATEYNFELSAVAQEGTMIFTIYQMVRVAPTGGGFLRITNPSIIITDSRGRLYEEDSTEIYDVSAINNYKGDVLTLALCDAPLDYTNSLLYYKNILQLLSGGNTSLWSYNSLEGRIQEILPRLYARMFVNMRFGIDVDLMISNYLRFKHVIEEDERVYMFTSMTYDYRTCQYSDCSLIQLVSWPPYYDRLAAYFFKDTKTSLFDLLKNYEAVTDDDGNITFPEITACDIFDFSDATYWDNTLLSWYDSENPRTCPITFIAGSEWAEAATDVTHARLYHRDSGQVLKEMLPILVYSENLLEEEQADVIEWLDWYYVIVQGGVIINESDGILTQKSTKVKYILWDNNGNEIWTDQGFRILT